MAINVNLFMAIVALIGVLFGAFLSPIINHGLNLSYTRKDIIFKKKLEYFEKIFECLENNLRLYNKAVNMTEKEAPKNILNLLKKERKNFLIMSSPLYFDSANLAKKIKIFVRGENKIFSGFKLLSRIDRKDREEIIPHMKKDVVQLREVANRIIFMMRKSL